MSDPYKCCACGHITDEAEYRRRRNQMVMTMQRWEELALVEAGYERLREAARAVVDDAEGIGYPPSCLGVDADLIAALFAALEACGGGAA